jgi:hypothetical protein
VGRGSSDNNTLYRGKTILENSRPISATKSSREVEYWKNAHERTIVDNLLPISNLLTNLLLLTGSRLRFVFAVSHKNNLKRKGCHIEVARSQLSTAQFLHPSIEEGMFQPQPTLYSPFSSYGAAPDFSLFQPSQSGRSWSVDSAGPTIVRNPIFTPINANTLVNNPAASNYNINSSAPHFKMAANSVNDLEQQEELARSFQPDLQVCRAVAAK